MDQWLGRLGKIAGRNWSFGKGDGEIRTPLANIAVTIKGERKSFEVRTDGEGKFDLTGLDPGKYQIEASLPEGYTPPYEHHLKQDFSVRDCGCGQANFFVRSDGRVSGHVFDTGGRPLKDVEIQLIPAERLDKGFKPEGMLYSETKYGHTDQEGRYRILEVPPGRYLLGVNVRSESPKSPYKTTFHPGVAESDQLGRFTIKGIKDHSYELELHWRIGALPTGRKHQGPEGVNYAKADKRLLTFSGDTGELKIVLSPINPQ